MNSGREPVSEARGAADPVAELSRALGYRVPRSRAAAHRAVARIVRARDATAIAATSGSSSSATRCSTSWSESALYAAHPEWSEGQLTRARASLVNAETRSPSARASSRCRSS